MFCGVNLNSPVGGPNSSWLCFGAQNAAPRKGDSVNNASLTSALCSECLPPGLLTHRTNGHVKIALWLQPALPGPTPRACCRVLSFLPELRSGRLALPGPPALGFRGFLCLPGSLRVVCCRRIYILGSVFSPSVVVPSALPVPPGEPGGQIGGAGGRPGTGTGALREMRLEGVAKREGTLSSGRNMGQGQWTGRGTVCVENAISPNKFSGVAVTRSFSRPAGSLWLPLGHNWPADSSR